MAFLPILKETSIFGPFLFTKWGLLTFEFLSRMNVYKAFNKRAWKWKNEFSPLSLDSEFLQCIVSETITL